VYTIPVWVCTTSLHCSPGLDNVNAQTSLTNRFPYCRVYGSGEILREISWHRFPRAVCGLSVCLCLAPTAGYRLPGGRVCVALPVGYWAKEVRHCFETLPTAVGVFALRKLIPSTKESTHLRRSTSVTVAVDMSFAVKVKHRVHAL